MNDNSPSTAALLTQLIETRDRLHGWGLETAAAHLDIAIALMRAESGDRNGHE